ncbi:hypothetical protein JQN72_03815 [Phycicoccus sp. CSK15P-2]|uniref:hypothetical protein n=1 Tax=Phycicoccus sp. CSK15P-2 TaxID=2807627 RepID=UPI0019501743|nr:hypothetical protein [Phycicoccus sp. CSK15P-2]MBM6403368.1 hypothetical protein [Phycicoccus sp. CSK15P-2]
MTQAPARTPTPVRADDRAGRRAWWGLALGLVVVAAAMVVPNAFGVVVKAGGAEPLLGDWMLRYGPSSLVAVALVVLAARPGTHAWLDALPWRRLLVLSWLVAVVWMVSLALVDGYAGMGRILNHGTEYLESARMIDDVGEALRTYVDRIPLDAPGHWAVHLAGHPPGAVLMFIGLDRIGLGAWQVAGPIVVAVGATVPAAVAVTLDRLGAQDAARRALPFLVLGPAAITSAVSADAVFAATAAWGMATLAAAGAATGARRGGLAVVAGLLLGWCLMESYGLGLLALLAASVLLAMPVPWRVRLGVGAVTAGVTLAVVLAFVPLGFTWWEAFPVLHDRYWDGLAAQRPGWYWLFGNIGALFLVAGLLLPAALGAASVPVVRLVTAAGRAAATPWEARVAPLVAGGVAMVAVAEVSLLSKAEVERIWLPFMPWMLLAVLWLPPRWQRWGLVAQGVLALVVQHAVRHVW